MRYISIWIIGLSIFLIACVEEKQINKTEDIIREEVIQEPSETVKYSEYGVDMLLGKFEPSEHEDFVSIDTKYADREGMLMHKDSYEAFIRMFEAAEKEGIKLVIRSATRNFDYQKGIWERKWTGATKVGGEDISKTINNPAERALKILEYSSMPGTSRHHWGTDIDLNSFDNEWFESGEGKKVWDWLERYASKYGFCRPYTKKDLHRPEGYNEERWHWSYIPLANHFMQLAREKHSDDHIEGFQGSNHAQEIKVVEKYVFGINMECL